MLQQYPMWVTTNKKNTLVMLSRMCNQTFS